MLRKALIGLAGVALLGSCGYFVATALAARSASEEVEAVFEALRATGASATHGEVTFDLASRTLVVADIVIAHTGAPSPLSVKLERLTATGVTRPAGDRVAADRVELRELTVTGGPATLLGQQATYATPRIEIAGYAGPPLPLATRRGSSAVDQLRASLEPFAKMTAASVTIPSMTASVEPATISGVPPLEGPVTVGYFGTTLSGLRDRRIASVTIDRAEIAMPEVQGAGLGRSAVTLSEMAVSDTDFGAVLDMLGEGAARDDSYRRLYGRITTGAYRAAFEKAGGFEMAGITLEDFAVKPSKFPLAELIAVGDGSALIHPPTSPEQLAELIERIAAFYEGIRIGKFETRGITVIAPTAGNVRLGAARIAGLEDGRVGEIAIEGLSAQSPNGPVRIGRVALIGLKIADLIRFASRAATTPPQDMTPDQLAQLLPMLEGIAVAKVEVPDDAGKPVAIENFEFGWDRFVGPIPTHARLSVALTAPVHGDDPGRKLLADAGITLARIAFDLEAGWTESRQTFAITPVVLDIADLVSAAASVSVGNVPRDLFSTDPDTISVMSLGVEAGPVELMVHDSGALDLAARIVAQENRTPLASARGALAVMARQSADAFVAGQPALKPLADAVVEFITTPKSTLRIKLTPKALTPVALLAVEAQTDPFAPLAHFTIDAKVTR
jgi:hypothetical protein